MTESRINDQNKSIDPMAMTRKPYSPPQLLNYGSLAVLTQGSGSGGVEGKSGMVTITSMKKGMGTPGGMKM